MSGKLLKPEVSCRLDVLDVADYFVWLDAQRPEPDVTQLKLQKLMYLAQANYLASTGLRLLDAKTKAFANGPVFDAVLRAFKRFGRQIIAVESDQTECPALPDDARCFLDEVWEKYQNWSASQLWKLSHEQAPWADHYREDELHVVIPDQAMAEYFRAKVPVEERVFHPNIVVLDSHLVDELDADEEHKVAQALAALV